jgi:type IV secretory pathway VirB3-like protein
MVVHDWFGLAIVVGATLGAIVAVASLFRPQIVPALHIYTRIAVAAIGLQMLIGLILVATGHRPHDALHWLYGAATLLALPLSRWMGAPLKDRDKRLWLTAGAVATVLLALRSAMTG